jgi:hypothetical protein
VEEVIQVVLVCAILVYFGQYGSFVSAKRFPYVESVRTRLLDERSRPSESSREFLNRKLLLLAAGRAGKIVLSS